jgi:hypothetical protein
MRRHSFLTIVLSICVFTLTCRAEEEATAESKEAWTELFNGKDLTGWKVNEHKDAVYVEDGCLVTHGRRAHAFYVGKGDGTEVYKDFHLRAEVKTEPKANSGIYFHTKYLASGWPNKGYEAQVNNTHSDPKKTGGLYSVQDNFQAPAKDGEWFTYEIIVRGKHIVIKINDQTISDYTEPEDLDRPERQLSEGLFALQAHDPGSKVYYRGIKVRRL